MLSFQHIINKKLLMRCFTFFFHTKSSTSAMYFTLNSPSNFGLAMSQVPSSHKWLQTAVFRLTSCPHLPRTTLILALMVICPGKRLSPEQAWVVVTLD